MSGGRREVRSRGKEGWSSSSRAGRGGGASINQHLHPGRERARAGGAGVRTCGCVRAGVPYLLLISCPPSLPSLPHPQLHAVDPGCIRVGSVRLHLLHARPAVLVCLRPPASRASAAAFGSDRRRIPDGCGCTLCCNWPSPKQRHRSINRAACGQPAPCACSACSHAHASAFCPPAKSVRCVRVWGGVSGSGVGWHSLLSAPHSSTFVGQHPEEEMIHPPIPTPAPAPAPAHPTTTHPHTHLCRSTTPRHEHKSFGCFSVPQITYAPKTIQCQLLPQYTSTRRLGSVFLIGYFHEAVFVLPFVL